MSSITQAINAYVPDFLFCADDTALSDLHSIHRAATAEGSEAGAALAALLEASLGSPLSFDVSSKKSAFIELAKESGIRCPRTAVIADASDLNRALNVAKFPIVIKADGTSGGMGVKVALNANDAKEGFNELVRPGGWLQAIVKSFDNLNAKPLYDHLFANKPVVTLQDYIQGQPANRAILCFQGVVLGGLSVRVHETVHPTGPSSVVEIIDHPEMESTAALLAKQLKLTGFCGFDFVLDSKNRAWLLELNARVTPISHLTPGCGALLAAVNPRLDQIKEVPAAEVGKMIALFPQEIERCAQSENLSTCYHDVPWGEAEFVCACLSTNSGISVTARVRKRITDSIRPIRPAKQSEVKEIRRELFRKNGEF